MLLNFCLGVTMILPLITAAFYHLWLTRTGFKLCFWPITETSINKKKQTDVNRDANLI